MHYLHLCSVGIHKSVHLKLVSNKFVVVCPCCDDIAEVRFEKESGSFYGFCRCGVSFSVNLVVEVIDLPF